MIPKKVPLRRYVMPQAYIDELEAKIAGMQKELQEIDQILGKALSYPRYCDDQKNFPGTTNDDGVCTGDATPAVLAIMAAARIEELEKNYSE